MGDDDDNVCKQCGQSFDTEEELEAHAEAEHAGDAAADGEEDDEGLV